MTDKNIERAMVAETTLNDYSANKEPQLDDLYDDAKTVAQDLITDLCHLLHLDEKTAGCMTPDAIRQLLDMAYDNFHAEAIEPDDIEIAQRTSALDFINGEGGAS